MRVTPRAGADRPVVWSDGVLALRVAASPVDGAANRSVVRMVAGLLRVPPSGIAIVAGERSRDKVLEITGIETAEVATRLSTVLPPEPGRAYD